MIERIGDRHGAGHRHQPPGRLQAVDAAPAGGRADRPTLVAAERHRDLAGRDQRGAAARRASGRVVGIVRVADRPGDAGMAAGGEAKILAGRLAGDDAASIEDAGDHGGVDLRDIALEHPAAIHQRHAGDADVVLDGDPLAGEHAARSAPDVGLPGPGIVGIFRRRRAPAGGARVFHRQRRLDQLVEPGIGGQRAGHDLLERGGVGRGQVHAERAGNGQQLIRRRRFHGYGHRSPSRRIRPAGASCLAAARRKSRHRRCSRAASPSL